MPCDKCGKEAPLHQTVFRQNIGLIVMRIYKTYAGSFCKKCVRSTFWSTFFTNLFLGWWGIHSFFFTFYYMIANTIQRLKLGKLKDASEGAVISE